MSDDVSPASSSQSSGKETDEEAYQGPSSVFSDDERFRLLEVNVTDFAIFMIDTEQRIATWNSGAERILGYSDSEIIGRPASIVFTPEDHQSGAEDREFQVARETGRSDDERFHVRKDGTRFWALGILTALYDGENRLRGYAKILRDFSERKQYEERIVALNERLRWAMTETHHRVKNNLQIISAIIDIQTIGRGEMVPATEFRRLSSQVRALAAVHDILTLDTKNGGNATAISLPVLLEKLLSVIESSMASKRIDHSLDYASISARRASSIALIVNELVTNGIKHGSGWVHVSLASEGSNVTLAVSDDGPGFPADFKERHDFNSGLELVENLTQLDLRGELDYGTRPEGGGRVTVKFGTDT